MESERKIFRRITPTFDFGECAGLVSEDVRNDLDAYSDRYACHDEAMDRLAFSREELDEKQMKNFTGLLFALSELESVVSDRMWAGGMFAAMQAAATPGFSLTDFWEAHLKGWQTEGCVNALSAVEEAYNEVKSGIPETLHERLTEYEKEKIRGIRMVAETTAEHGFEFGVQVLEELGFSVSAEDVTTFYGFFPNEMKKSVLHVMERE